MYAELTYLLGRYRRRVLNINSTILWIIIGQIVVTFLRESALCTDINYGLLYLLSKPILKMLEQIRDGRITGTIFLRTISVDWYICGTLGSRKSSLRPFFVTANFVLTFKDKTCSNFLENLSVSFLQKKVFFQLFFENPTSTFFTFTIQMYSVLK